MFRVLLCGRSAALAACLLVMLGLTMTGANAAGVVVVTLSAQTAVQDVPNPAVQVATFSDSNVAATPADFTNEISFGDGSPDAVGVIAGSAGAYTLSLDANSHVYATSGVFPLTVTVTDTSTGATDTKTEDVAVSDATLNPAPGSLDFGTVAGTATLPPTVIFTDANPAGVPSDYTATVNFGDGTSAAASAITGAPSGFSVVFPSHVFTQFGNLAGNVTVTDQSGATAVKTFTVDVQDQTNLNVTSASSAVFGQPVTFTVTATGANALSGTPTGTVTLSSGSTQLGSATLSNGSATITTAAIPAGAGPLTLTYSGDAAHAAATISVSSLNVTKDLTTTTVSINPTMVVAGQTATITASVSANSPGAGTPTGTVSFYNGSVSAGNLIGTATLANGSANIQYKFAASGMPSIVAVYTGDASFTGSTAATTTVTVGTAASTTTLTSSSSQIGRGQSVTFTATITPVVPGSGSATGTVSFYNGDVIPANLLGTANVSGNQASFTTTSLPSGPDEITAVYNGDVNFSTSSSQPFLEVVTPNSVSVAVASSANPAAIGAPFTLTATVTNNETGFAAPIGTVTFFIGTTPIGTANLNGAGVAAITTTEPAGTYSITATYNGEAIAAPATSPAISEVVNNAVPTVTGLTPVSVVEGSSDTTITVSGTSFIPGSIVNVNGTPISTTYLSPTELTAVIPAADLVQATGSTPLSITVTSPAPGGGTSATSAAGTFTVRAASFNVVGTPSASTTAGLTTLTANFNSGNVAATAGEFTATIDWGDGRTTAGTVVANGGGSFAVTGTHTYTVAAGGNVTFSPIVTITETGGATASGTGSVTITGPIATIPAGLSMIGLPYDYSATDLSAAEVLGLSPDSAHGNQIDLVTYDPATNAYVFPPNLPGTNSTNAALDGSQTIPGQGYFVRTTASTNITQTGATVPSPFTATIRPGWNLISDPFTTAVPTSSLTFQTSAAIDGQPSGTSLTLQQAQTGGLIGNQTYGYDQSSNSYVVATTLEPFQGYWIFVNGAANSNAAVSITYTNQGS